jgi:hypothetical protein
LLHRQISAIPAAAIANESNATGAWSPYAELHPRHSLLDNGMSTHAAPNVVVIAFRKQMAIHFSHPFLTEGVGIVLFVSNASAINLEPVTAAWVLLEYLFKKPGMMGAFHGQFLALIQ